MEDVTLTQLFAKMDAHLERQDVYLASTLEVLKEQNVMMQRMSELLVTTAKEVAAIHAEASHQHAATMAAFEALTRRLEEGQ
jgi:hypothetical protein